MWFLFIDLFGVKIINLWFLDTTVFKIVRFYPVFYQKCAVLGVDGIFIGLVSTISYMSRKRIYLVI